MPNRPGFDTVCPDCGGMPVEGPIIVHGSPEDTSAAGLACTLGVLLTTLSAYRGGASLPDDFDTMLAEVQDMLKIKANDEGVAYHY